MGLTDEFILYFDATGFGLWDNTTGKSVGPRPVAPSVPVRYFQPTTFVMAI